MEHLSGVPPELSDPDVNSALTAHVINECVNMVDPDRRQQVLSQFSSTLLNNKQLTDVLQTSMTQGIIDRFSHVNKTKTKIYVKAKLSGSQQCDLANTFSCFNLDFSRADDCGPHAFAREHRKLSLYKLLNIAKISATTRPGPGYDCCFKDVGGNPVSHLVKDRFFSHCCAPVLDINDAARKSRYHEHLRTFDPVGKSAETVAHYNLHMVGDGRVVCKSVAEHCYVKAPVLLFVHSVYDISVRMIAQMMHNSDANVAYGCFIFDVSVLYEVQGELPKIGCCFKRIVRNGRAIIRFWFPNDTQLGYEHDYLNYVELIRCFYVRHQTRYEVATYLFNLMGLHDNVVFFEVLRNTSGSVPKCSMFRVLTDSTLTDMTVINYWHFETLTHKLVNRDVYDRLSPVRLVVPTSLFDNLVSYAFNLPEAKFTVKNLLAAATSLNNRFVTNGAVVSSGAKIPPFQLQKLAHAVFLLVYISSYECSQTLVALIEQETRVRSLSNKGLLPRFFENVKQRVREKFSSRRLHALENISLNCDEDRLSAEVDESTSTLKNFVQKFIQFCTVKRLLNVDFHQNFVKYFSVEQEIDYICDTVYKRGKLFNNTNPCEIQPFQAMLSSLPEDSTAGLSLGVTACHECVCAVPTKTVPNNSRGHCVLESFMATGVVSDTSVNAVKRRLLKSHYIEKFSQHRVLMNYLETEMTSDDDRDAYFPPALELLMLCALEYSVAVCVHLQSRTTSYRFSKGDLYHFIVKNSHCSYLKTPTRLPMVDTVMLSTLNDYEESPQIFSLKRERAMFDKVSEQYTILKSTGKLDVFENALRVVNPRAVTSMMGYRSLHGLITAEAVARNFSKTLKNYSDFLLVDANTTQLEAVLSVTNATVHVILDRDDSDMRSDNVDKRIVQLSTANMCSRLSGDAVKMEMYDRIVRNRRNGFSRIHLGTLFFSRDYLGADYDSLDKYIEDRVHFSLCLLEYGGTFSMVINSLVAPAVVNVLTILNSLFNKVEVYRLNMTHHSVWTFGVRCVDYFGIVSKRDNLLVRSPTIMSTYSNYMHVVVERFFEPSQKFLSDLYKEINSGDSVRYFHPDCMYDEMSIAKLISNKYLGYKTLSGSTSKKVLRTSGMTLADMLEKLAASRVAGCKLPFFQMARVRLSSDVDIFDDGRYDISGTYNFDEYDQLFVVDWFSIVRTGDKIFDSVIARKKNRKLAEKILGKALCKKIFYNVEHLASAGDRVDLGLTPHIVERRPKLIRTFSGDSDTDDYALSDTDDSDSDDDDDDSDGKRFGEIAASRLSHVAGEDPFSHIHSDAVPAATVVTTSSDGSSTTVGVSGDVFNVDIDDVPLATMIENVYGCDIFRSLETPLTPSLTDDSTGVCSSPSNIESGCSFDDVSSESTPRVNIPKIFPLEEIRVSEDRMFLNNVMAVSERLDKNVSVFGNSTTSPVSYETDDVPTVIKPDDNFVTRAVDEYKAMLELTHSANISNLSRVYKKYVSDNAYVSRTIDKDTFTGLEHSPVIPHAKDFGIMNRQQKWIIRPANGSSALEYGWYFNGDKIVPFPRRNSAAYKAFVLETGYIVVNDYCKLALDGVTRESVRDVDVSKVDLSVVNFVQAVPGAGKTTHIIDSHVPYYHCDTTKVSNVILCTTEGKDDFRKRMTDKAESIGIHMNGNYEQIIRNRYVTLSSFLINNRNMRTSDTLFIDEAFMHHPGALFLAMAISKSKKVVILGDCLQIPYVNRLETFVMQYGDLNQFICPTTIMNTSYRCPVDVAKFLSPHYSSHGLAPSNDERGMISTRNVASRSMTVKKFNGLPDLRTVPKDVQILTFTQALKSSIKSYGHEKVSTVHEYEGKQSENIILVRDTDSLEDRIPNDMHYLVVAVSRHTKTFVYFSKRVDDKLSTMIRQYYDKYSSFSDYLSTSAGSVDFSTRYMGELTVAQAVDSYKTMNCRDPNGRARFHRIHVRLGDETKLEYVRKPHGYEVMLTLTGSISARNVRSATPLIRNFVVSRRITELDIADSFFETVPSIVVSSIFYQFVGKECRYYRRPSEKFDEIPFEVFDALNRNAINAVPMEKDLYIPEVYDFVPIAKKNVADDIHEGELQWFVNDVFRGSGDTDQSKDSWMVHHYDLNLSLGDVRIIPHRGLYTEKRFDNMTPILRTPIPHIRSEFTAELLVALQKRNCNVPEAQGIVDVHHVSNMMIEKLVSECFDRDVFVNVVNKPISVSASEVCDWLKNQPPAVVNQIVGDFALHDSPLNEYLMSIKPTAKPILKHDADQTYAPLQTILYHEKFINAIFCPIFREIKARLHKCLRKNLKIFSDVSMKDFERLMDRDISDQCFALFSGDDSLIYNGREYLEVDISKYDKSQGDLALEYELKCMRLFGVSEYYIELWKNAHVSTVARSLSTGVKIRINYQRKSGDASTFLGNTLFLMGVLSYVFPFRNLHGIDYDGYMKPQTYNYVFNLEVKFFRYNVPYFCSKFLIRTFDGWRMVPDPVKLVCKLGRHDLVNETHVECYRISISDHLDGFVYTDVANDVAVALSERYQTENNYVGLLQRLHNVVKRGTFTGLFTALPGAKIDRTRSDFIVRD
uniref:ORF1 n=2 Tax=unclassified Riboviria TaxID=2585030 RepID=A0A8E8FUX7_9VIRU|nr:ORF1 [Bemisia tabaci nege-like virus 3]